MTADLAPRHLQLRDLLLRRWKAAGLRPGDRIESQNEIIGFCDFSLMTVTKTLKDLESEGVIQRQVGKGSFLVKAIWAEDHRRVGLFYNRDVVGGGIFDNAFYTRLVVALEKAIVSDGHEFVLGSFTNDHMPLELWDVLDVVMLTSVTGQTRLDPLERTPSLVCVIDERLERPGLHSFRIAYGAAFRAMFAHLADRPLRYLYLDSTIVSNDQQRRLLVAREAWAASRPDNRLDVIRVDQERSGGAPGLEQALRELAPDVIFGHVHVDWHRRIAAVTGARVYPFGLDSEGPGFVVWTEAWTREILPAIWHALENRQAEGRVHPFPARFQP